jgi:arabinogalactan oligomer / maltooligosaccharide transport system substrate-binding protein
MTLKKTLIALLTVAASFGLAFGQGLQVWTSYEGPSLEWLRDQAASFTDGFGVPVNVVQIAFGDMEGTILRAAPQGEAADVFHGVAHDWIGNLATAGVLADMSGYATSAYLADLAEQARLAFTFSGRLFGLPTDVQGPALIVNTDLVPNPPATYEEMIELAQELTTADTFGYMLDAGNFYFSYVYVRTFGGAVFGRDAVGDLDPTDVQLASEGAVRGVEELRDLRYRYGLLPSGADYGVGNGLFIDGRLAMWYTGPWETANYVNAGLNFIVMPIPPLADGTEFGGFMGVQGIAVNQFSNNKVDAANFAKWITRSAAQVSLAEVTSRIPASQAAVAQVADDPVIAGFGRALQTAEPMPNIPQMGQVWGPAINAFTVIMENEDSDIEATLQQAVDEILGN